MKEVVCIRFDLDPLQEEMVATGVNVEDGTGEGRKGRGHLASSEGPSCV